MNLKTDVNQNRVQKEGFTVTQLIMFSDCSYDGRSYTHGSVFTAADNCNLCRCSKGFVACTNSTGCGDQGIILHNANNAHEPNFIYNRLPLFNPSFSI